MAGLAPSVLSHLACVVQAAYPGLKDVHSLCGVMVYAEQGLVLSHGSILADRCQTNHMLRSKIKNGQAIENTDLEGCAFHVVIDKCWRALRSEGKSISSFDPQIVTGKDEKGKSFSQPIKCKVIGAVRNLDFHNTVCRLMPDNSGWSFIDSSNDKSDKWKDDANVDIDPEITLNLLSYFLVLQCEPLSYHGTRASQLGEIFPWNSAAQGNEEKFNVGAQTEILATPFAGLNPAIFFNSFSRGVLSNVSGPDSCWMLTDARCIPGSEGGPVFIVRDNGVRCLAGMVVAALCWKNQELMGLSLACSMGSIYKFLPLDIQHRLSAQGPPTLSKTGLYASQCRDQLSAWGEKAVRKFDERKWSGFLPSVVLVKVGRTWGTGFVINGELGLVLTCSHVIKDTAEPGHPVMIRPYSSSPLLKASVVYRQVSQEIQPFDVALLSCPGLQHCLPCSGSPKIVSPLLGQQVYVIGHAVFPLDLRLQPSVTSGVVSKVIKVEDHPVMVQTTCAVHAGTSGGPLVDADGNLVGMVVCNTADKSSNTVYPTVNFSIPAITVWPALERFINLKDTSMLRSLRVNDSRIRRLWALETSAVCQKLGKSKL